MRYRDRRDAGVALAGLVTAADPARPVVAALPRGGVPVGYEVAKALGCPLDVLLVRKIGLPGQPELAIGAVAEGGITTTNPEVIRLARVAPETLEAGRQKAQRELETRIASYRGSAQPVEIGSETTVVVVDDGLATGSTAIAAIEALRSKGPGAIWLAVPVAPADTVDAVRDVADRVLVGHIPRRFHAVGVWYEDFSQTSDNEVRELIRRSRLGD